MPELRTGDADAGHNAEALGVLLWLRIDGDPSSRRERHQALLAAQVPPLPSLRARGVPRAMAWHLLPCVDTVHATLGGGLVAKGELAIADSLARVSTGTRLPKESALAP